MVRFLILSAVVLLLSCIVPTRQGISGWGPLVVITFDDAHESIYSIAFPLMKEINPAWAATHFLPSTYAGMPDNMTIDNLKEMERADWETGGHGITHENLSSVSLDSAEIQIKGSYDFLKSNGLSHQSYAYAWGNYNADVQEITEKWFKNIRTANDFSYLDGVNRKELGYFAVKPGHSAADVIGRVEEAKLNGLPLVVIGFHAVLADTAAPLDNVYFWRESRFRKFLEYLREQDHAVCTIKEAMEILKP